MTIFLYIILSVISNYSTSGETESNS
jgi:hypothetical protein